MRIYRCPSCKKEKMVYDPGEQMFACCDPTCRAGVETLNSPASVLGLDQDQVQDWIDGRPILPERFPLTISACCSDTECSCFQKAFRFFTSWGIEPQAIEEETRYLLRFMVPNYWDEERQESFMEELANRISSSECEACYRRSFFTFERKQECGHVRVCCLECIRKGIADRCYLCEEE